ncbi:DinB family protein [uncultured Microscilla sp.]|uniref:DinB family protein n=1 Tax=uncultured Microscilla sp. TaxID=432653 RepID=UPI00260CE5AB|nr:DinB family protein [uncultured Microscilla sp.]
MIQKPLSQEYSAYYQPFIDLIEGDDLTQILENTHSATHKLIRNLPAKKQNHRYAEGKWTIKEVLLHLLDTERVFVYRALRFARQDKTDLPGFEQNDYVSAANASERSMESIAQELAAVRRSTILLFQNFNEQMMNSKGTANGLVMSVRAISLIIPGHELHHCNIIRERYL